MRENDAHWRVHLAPVLGWKHPRDWAAGDMREVVRTLDVKVRDGALSWKTAANAWGTATSMCASAQKSKIEALRCRDDNPSNDVEGPDRGAKLAKQFLFPSEFAALVACDAVPLVWRRTAAIAVYLYARAGELRVLHWSDVDLEHATIHVHRAADRTNGAEKATKGNAARRIPIEPTLLPLLRAMHHEAGGSGRVLRWLPSDRSLAKGLRRELLRAGVRRPELHAGSATTKLLTWHDLRARGITWMAVRQDAPMAIMQRAGHADIATTMGYVRTAEVVRGGTFGEPFPPLPQTLLGLPAEPRLRSHLRSHPIKAQGSWRRGRDSNPRNPCRLT